LIEKLKQNEEAERQIAREAARQRVLSDFEKSQTVGSSSSSFSANVARNTGGGLEGERGVKRKFELDDGRVEQLVLESEERALKLLEAEQAENRKAKLPSFWLPTLTPDAGPSKLMEEPKLHTLCKASEPPHPITLKSLTEVKFATANSTSITSTDEAYTCWTCRKSFSNVTKIQVLNPCGHTLCTTCVDTLVKKEKKCAACDQPVKDLKGKGPGSGFIEIKREGTGFASGGMSEVKKFDLAFQ